MARITVTHRYGEAFDVQIRGYRLVSDEPVTVGGEDQGPTPTELMVAGLAACAAEEGVNHLTQRGFRDHVFGVTADFVWEQARSRIDQVRLTIEPPPGLDADDLRALEAAILNCPARRMLTEPPTITYSLSGAPAHASA